MLTERHRRCGICSRRQGRRRAVPVIRHRWLGGQHRRCALRERRRSGNRLRFHRRVRRIRRACARWTRDLENRPSGQRVELATGTSQRETKTFRKNVFRPGAASRRFPGLNRQISDARTGCHVSMGCGWRIEVKAVLTATGIALDGRAKPGNSAPGKTNARQRRQNSDRE